MESSWKCKRSYVRLRTFRFCALSASGFCALTVAAASDSADTGSGEGTVAIDAVDFVGSRCGIDPGVETKPYLYYCPVPSSVVGSTPTAAGASANGHPLWGSDYAALDLDHPICVEACPSGDTTAHACLSRPAIARSNVPRLLAGARRLTALNASVDGHNITAVSSLPYQFIYIKDYRSFVLERSFCVPESPTLEAQAMQRLGASPSPLWMLLLGGGVAAFFLVSALAVATYYTLQEDDSHDDEGVNAEEPAASLNADKKRRPGAKTRALLVVTDPLDEEHGEGQTESTSQIDDSSKWGGSCLGGRMHSDSQSGSFVEGTEFARPRFLSRISSKSSPPSAPTPGYAELPQGLNARTMSDEEPFEAAAASFASVGGAFSSLQEWPPSPHRGSPAYSPQAQYSHMPRSNSSPFFPTHAGACAGPAPMLHSSSGGHLHPGGGSIRISGGSVGYSPTVAFAQTR